MNGHPDESMPTRSPMLTDEARNTVAEIILPNSKWPDATEGQAEAYIRAFLRSQDREALAEVICDTLEAGDHKELTFSDAQAVVDALLGGTDA